MTKREEMDYVDGYRLGTGLVRSYGYKSVIREATMLGAMQVNGSHAFTAGMVDAALALVQVGVK